MKKADMLKVTAEPISPTEIISSIEAKDCGAIVTFIGKVRGYSGDRKVKSLEHAAAEGAEEKILKDIAAGMRKIWDLGEIAFCYRSGPVAADEVTAVISVSAERRPEAFAACQYAIDRFKQSISAKEIMEDGETRIN